LAEPNLQLRHEAVRTGWSQRRIGVIAAMLAIAVPSVAARTDTTASVAAPTAALQSCPTVEEEIVDLHILADGLKESRAVGLLEKLRLKASIESLISRFQSYHDGRSDFSLVQLQEQYDVLLMRIASHLQHKDTILHKRLCNAWFQIWQDLEDPQRFAEKFS
jgi:hypothetical protein